MKNLFLLVSLLNKSIFILISIGLALATHYAQLSLVNNIIGVSVVYLITITFNIIIENKLVVWKVNYRKARTCKKTFFGKTCLLHFYH